MIKRVFTNRQTAEILVISISGVFAAKLLGLAVLSGAERTLAALLRSEVKEQIKKREGLSEKMEKLSKEQTKELKKIMKEKSLRFIKKNHEKYVDKYGINKVLEKMAKDYVNIIEEEVNKLLNRESSEKKEKKTEEKKEA